MKHTRIILLLIVLFKLNGMYVYAQVNTLSELEDNIGKLYPNEFKEYLNQLKGCKKTTLRLMHDSFELVREDDIEIFNDRAFNPLQLVDNINNYIRLELKNENLIALPIARSQSGDRFGFLFLIYDSLNMNNMNLYHRDTDRFYYKTIPLGSFFDYVADVVDYNPKQTDITDEACASDFNLNIQSVDYIITFKDSLCIIDNDSLNINPVEIDFKFDMDSTIISIKLQLKLEDNKIFSYITTFKDLDENHLYSYKNKLDYNYFSILQYCMIKSIYELKNKNYEYAAEINEYLTTYTISQMVKLGINSKNER